MHFDGTDDYFYQSPVSGQGSAMTLAAFVAPTGTTWGGTIMTQGRATGAQFSCIGITSGNGAFAMSDLNGTQGSAKYGAGSLSKDTYYRIVGVFRLPNDREVFVNDVSQSATDTTSILGGSLNRTLVGAEGDNVIQDFFEGDIIEACMWNDDLTDAEVQSYMVGASPLLIRPGNLKAWYRLDHTNDILNMVQNLAVTVNSAPGATQTDLKTTTLDVFYEDPFHYMKHGAFSVTVDTVPYEMAWEVPIVRPGPPGRRFHYPSVIGDEFDGIIIPIGPDAGMGWEVPIIRPGRPAIKTIGIRDV